MSTFNNDYDVEVALAKDPSGAALREIKDSLQQGLADLRRTMDRGLASDEFKQADALRKAFDAALATVDATAAELQKR